MKFNLKQDSGVVGGEILVEVRTRTAINCHLPAQLSSGSGSGRKLIRRVRTEV
jgi:hypothetical protein